MTTVADIEREEARRAALQAETPNEEAPQSYQPQQRQRSLGEQFFYREPEKNPGRISSALTGFNTAFERPIQGLLQPFLGGQKGFENTVKNREADYSTAHEAHPGYTFAGELAGDIGMGIPFMAAGGAGVTAASKLPGIGRYLSKSPYMKNIAESILGGGLYGGSQYVKEDESRLSNALLGGGIGGAFGVAAPAVNIATNLGMKGLKHVGGMLKGGYEKIQRARGSEPHIIKEMLKHYSPEEISTALSNQAKAQNVGIELTPSEAAASKIPAKHEGKLGSSEEGERSLYEFKKGQKTSEAESIQDFLNKISGNPEVVNEKVRDITKGIISKKEKALQAKAKPYYETAEKKIVPANSLNQLTKDGNINKAYSDVLNDPVFQSEIEGFAPNSIKVLDEVKKRLNGLRGKALKSGDKNEARIIKNSTDKLVNAMDKISPEYKKARAIYSEESPLIDLVRNREVGKIAKLKDDQLKNVSKIIFDPGQTDPKALNRLRDEISKENPEAWAGIVRNAMENKLATTYEGTTGYHGTNFYRQILANDRTYKQFHNALKGNKEAQERLEFMKTVFKDLINEPTVKGASAQAKTSMDAKRSTLAHFAKWAANATGGHEDKAAIDIITSDKWKKAFFDAKMKDTEEGKIRALANIFSDATKEQHKKAATSGAVAKGTATRGEPYIETDNYEVY
jgi:hypothetical protein